MGKYWVVIDRNHKWFGKKVKLIANVKFSYLIGYGIQEDWVLGDQIKKL